MTKEDLSYFKDCLGDQNVLSQEAELKNYGTDWTKAHPSNPSLILLPKTTQEVSRIVKYCNEKKIKAVPSGGRTGLAGGAIAKDQEIVISLSKMNKILEIDSVNMSITCEAGVTTQALQEAAKEKNLFFGLDLSSKGSSQIGGNISTNAGGLKLIRYGGMREQVLGVEVVLADGTILDLNRGLRKNNSGYDLKQLFIAGEGTLGIITKATLKLLPRPKNYELACIALEHFSQIPKVINKIQEANIQLSAFEFWTEKCMRVVLKNSSSLKNPFQKSSPLYALIEFESASENAKSDLMEKFLESLYEENIIQDAVIASNSSEFQSLWGLRENISESITKESKLVKKNDISLSISRLNLFIEFLNSALESFNTKIDILLFGHIGDGNIHLNYLGYDMEVKKFKEDVAQIEKIIFQKLFELRGSISAEHGIGLIKKKELLEQISPEELLWMKKIKNLFDPQGILNPGKIFD